MTNLECDKYLIWLTERKNGKVAAAKMETISGKFLKIFLKSQIGQVNIPWGKTWNFPKCKQGKIFKCFKMVEIKMLMQPYKWTGIFPNAAYI